MLDTIITTAPEAFALFDTSLRYVRVNDALAEMHGLPADEHFGRTLGDVVPDSGHAGPLRRVLETGEPIVDVEVSGARQRGSDETRTWLVSYYPVHDADGKIALAGQVHDRHHRAQARRAARAAGRPSSARCSTRSVTVEARMEVLVDALVPALVLERVGRAARRATASSMQRHHARRRRAADLTVPLLGPRPRPRRAVD